MQRLAPLRNAALSLSLDVRGLASPGRQAIELFQIPSKPCLLHLNWTIYDLYDGQKQISSCAGLGHSGFAEQRLCQTLLSDWVSWSAEMWSPAALWGCNLAACLAVWGYLHERRRTCFCLFAAWPVCVTTSVFVHCSLGVHFSPWTLSGMCVWINRWRWR